MMTQIDHVKMTYLVITRNKLPYLREQMCHLLENVEADDEIIVIDGKSTDGTAVYLAELQTSGKITRFISEPDKGEAHGTNKGLLLARGELIKPITDDDVFHWPSIREAKQFMLDHPEVDVLSGNIGYAVFGSHYQNIVPSPQYFKDYMLWLSTGQPFPFTGLALLIRKASLPLVGLFYTGCRAIDHEYALRVSSVGNLAWYSSLFAVRVHNPSSNYQYDDRIFEEQRGRMFNFYRYRPPLRRQLLFLRLKIARIRRELCQLPGGKAEEESARQKGSFHDFYELIAEKMRTQNTDTPGKFFYRGMPEGMP